MAAILMDKLSTSSLSLMDFSAEGSTFCTTAMIRKSLQIDKDVSTING